MIYILLINDARDTTSRYKIVVIDKNTGNGNVPTPIKQIGLPPTFSSSLKGLVLSRAS